ncbi:hypothetical protein GCM10009609_28550 [Pseudonocardia aurantiaca]
MIAIITGHSRPASCTAYATNPATTTATRRMPKPPAFWLKISTSAAASTTASTVLGTRLPGPKSIDDVVTSCLPPTSACHSAASGSERRR